MLPEEQEFNRLETDQTEIEEQVTSAELTLETSKTETAQFQYRYHQTVGRQSEFSPAWASLNDCLLFS